MTGVGFLPIFLVGLAGSVHCIGMCGGIVGALSWSGAKGGGAAGGQAAGGTAATVRLMPQVPAGGARWSAGAFEPALRVLAYNTGRIASYATAGAIAAGLAGGVRTLAGVGLLQVIGYALANLMLVALGLWLMDAWRGLARVEAAGAWLWRRIAPLTRRLLPIDRPAKMLVAGLLWGWLPCGMVYSMLLTAALTQSAPVGAAVMATFGLGTLPMLLVLGFAGQRLRSTLQARRVRQACGLLVVAFGLLGLARLGLGLPPSWIDALCLVPAVHGGLP